MEIKSHYSLRLKSIHFRLFNEETTLICNILNVIKQVA